MLIGFDFPFGFPVGTAQRLGYRGLAWRNLWQTLEDEISDHEDNRNNRFDVAESLNVRLTDEASSVSRTFKLSATSKRLLRLSS